MLFDPTGKWILPAGTVRTYDWSPLVDAEALPSWLTLYGTSAIQTVFGVDGDRGFARFQTKSATPASGDEAGVRVTPDIDTSRFREIGFFVYGWSTDTNTSTLVNKYLRIGNGSTNGMFVAANDTAGVTRVSIRDTVVTNVDMTWEFVVGNNGTRRKNVGIIIRPATREVFVTSGDPMEGGGILFYHQGAWVDSTVPPHVAVITRSAAQRLINLNRVKLRLVST